MPSPERPKRQETPGAARVLNPLYRERLFALIDEAPFVRHMGMRITDLAWGRATVEMEAAALYAFAQVRQKPVLCFAHVTNQMGRIDGDFEKGEADGSKDALDLIAIAADRLRSRLRP